MEINTDGSKAKQKLAVWLFSMIRLKLAYLHPLFAAWAYILYFTPNSLAFETIQNQKMFMTEIVLGSKSALQGSKADCNVHKDSLLSQFYAKIQELLFAGYVIRIYWVRGRAAIAGNEIADVYAGKPHLRLH